jgi:undecaprenyl-diphosphatase
MMPPAFDTWFMARLGEATIHRPVLDLMVDGGIQTHILGGIWYAATLFLLWTDATRRHETRAHLRIVTILHASLLAIVIAALVGMVISWIPPTQHPELDRFYSRFGTNYNASSFPSQSTSVYTAVASGIVSLRRRTGLVLGLVAVCLVGLPRVYVGGHYPTDVGAGFLIGIVAYWLAATFLEGPLASRVTRVLDTRRSWRQTVGILVVFVWIFELGTGFHEVVWVNGAIRHYLSGEFASKDSAR